jgi:hypothetical protein
MRTSASILALAAAISLGCAAPLTTALLSGSRKDKSIDAPADADAAQSLRAAARRKATAERPPSHEEAFAEILHELQEIRAIDPEAEAELMADLKEAKPEHYPMIVSAFRTALNYRQQLAEKQRTSAEASEDSLLASDDSFTQLASHAAAETDRESDERAAAVKASLASARAAKRERSKEQQSATKPDEKNRYVVAPPLAPESANSIADSIVPVETVALRPAPMAAALTPVEARLEAAIVPESVVASDHNPYRNPLQAIPSPDSSPGDWHAELTRSISQLELSVSPKPTSVGELHDHMRLRTLQLLAGRQEEAYRPIPGASADQQDYWSKQLFAMSAYLDAGGNLDDKQRAAAALSALDDARAKLSELATLQLRNAAFVSSVDGFGAYEPAKTTTFQPGQKVTLYAEVENFRSNSAEDGYHTSLATSYQVLDKTGRRVDGKQFPDVADKCRNRRRDFHMQYEFPLPTRIYPGPYELELTITDHNSGKIGQTTLPFEIAGDK